MQGVGLRSRLPSLQEPFGAMVPNRSGFQQTSPYNQQSAAIGHELDPEVAALLNTVEQAFFSQRTATSQKPQNQTPPAIQKLMAYRSTERGQSLLTSLHQNLEAQLEVWLPQLRKQFQALQSKPSHELHQEYQQMDQLLSQLEQQQQQKQQLAHQEQLQKPQLIQQQQEQQPQLLPPTLSQAMIEQLFLHSGQPEQIHSYCSLPPALAQEPLHVQPLNRTMVAHRKEEAMVQWPPVSQWMTAPPLREALRSQIRESELQIILLQLQLHNHQLQSSLPGLLREYWQNGQLLHHLEQHAGISSSGTSSSSFHQR
eukprot:TRINITY_DN11170_c0_g2_i1.p1 TRINITY_DN11170_c0_g2~~TRINITY_DN11170_c0_g2_i1.p1  ORF type:complete len:312 (-),score=59.15 TRINITY_DN11170_c0_g2_i1:221-1156(-)